MDTSDIESLIKLLKDNNLSEITFEEDDRKIEVKQELSSSPLTATPADASPKADTVTQKSKTINAPMIGTFYQAPSPDEPAFVKVGDKINVGDKVGLIEAMKMLTDIKSDQAGEVAEILVPDGEGVEYGQPLIRLK
ncbi:acetyl-CoA carboxylase biotin carboxyl carrier protein subunit [Lentilactobacillus curieae]|uniref:Biotin carboxyl carrier protein of acetyl-CoA carboxylase n=1 Tax=Lentilactobacillus curieae TaxID=1138822 RepID=A0A1S6QH28_9LACO|nr:acetyl-CoA carboxylase biotin carboxyl carrier protein [Lentilactobacillus curieae]AQW20927.1 acetyl-CoA carboxylase biotin carboxyl carrier protein subunit [Lentilactobacillus curieae]